jgi:tRNA dimethylallyltransferase
LDGVREGSSRREPSHRSDLAPGLICPVIAGPTAVGKTSLVLELATEFPIEVVSLDSRQIYRGLRIGTAQPTTREKAACRHHLIDFLDPEQRYSAQRFRQDFEEVVPGIIGRGHLPVLVGGAGLYLRALTVGFFDLPHGSETRLPAVRRAVAALSDEDLARELRRVDPASADSLHPRDRYRRSRALEIYRLAGLPSSELAAQQRPNPALGLRYAAVRLARPVPEIDRRIRDRTAIMLAEGWIQETRDLLTRHRPDCPGLMSLGYAEIVRFLHDALPEDALADAIVLATRRYAKRQRTWFGKLDARASGPPQDPDLRTVLGRLIQSGLDKLERI